jgi:tryptophan-rich sensory protein
MKAGKSIAHEGVVLGGFLAVNVAVSLIGGYVTATSVGTWYQTLVKPPFTPPDWVFAPVWTTLYVLIALAGWRAWRRVGFSGARRLLALYGLQLALNLLWSFLFFGFKAPIIALAEVALLWLAILATTIELWRVDRRAGILFLPYLAWVGFAIVLNAGVAFMN